MVKKKRGLGRGLSALIPDEPKQDSDLDKEEGKIIDIKLSKIKPNKNQPREKFNLDTIEELSRSIDKVGLIQPIVVKKSNSGYEIIAGERRFRAVKNLGVDTIPAIIREDDKKSAEIALIENIQRENLNPIEEAYAYENIIKKHEITQEQLSNIIGKSRSYIANLMRLLKLSDKIQDMMKEGLLSSGHARALLSISEKEVQYDIAKTILEEKLSVRETEKLVSKYKNKNKTKKKNKVRKDPMIAEIEEDLRKVFGTKVNINKGRKKGKIEIEYYNDDDLDRIIELLNK
ncbi:ParB/RepB/Spo0J family partition protein [Senegalia massiliensis]|uniref:ParB/RepB/Spo0J family partition protein n=1 Tax=Senegalia massiliensis TaxID=1720316 RepID=A0A845R0M0_9CLOT|nr:ParB/RepB/Spo0J family partition protein [Senegalia massiliensis]NBI08121.1 ParB/RepB/Spo0J family partition protein [Senegalia massiliensis]